MTKLYVKSHVARDLLQSAALFKTDKLVVWEYVSNSLQYVDNDINPIVKVSVNNSYKYISIADNGRGMDWDGLKNFFVMHGENIDRREGKVGRGRFGTGKSAAFGIANILRLTTVRNGKRSKVELMRSDVQEISSEDPIPVHEIEREVSTDESNGTFIEIKEIHIKSLDQKGIIEFIERHLAKWPKNATVFVNNHECEYSEPPIANIYRFRTENFFSETLGDVELIIKESKKPLDKELRGISIYSKGVWLETTLAGSENRDMAQYLFGEIDVIKLEEDDSPIPPYDHSRSMKLNPNNDIVKYLYAFIGEKIEMIRRDLVKREKKRTAEEEAKKLAEQAVVIAEVINEDFHDYREKAAKVKAKISGARELGKELLKGNDNKDDVVFGNEIPGEIESEFGGIGSTGENKYKGNEQRELNPQVTPGSQDSEKHAKPAGGEGKKKRSSGGFRVDFKNLGDAEDRATYFEDEHTIYINLDHPQVVAARKDTNIEDPIFRRLTYEIAFSEYAIALSSLLDQNNQFLDPSDAIFEIKNTLNRITRRTARLYER